MPNQNGRSLHLNCWLAFLLSLVDYMLILHRHSFHFLLELTIPPREIEDNARAKFWGTKKVCCVPNSLVREILKKIAFFVFLNYEYVCA